MDNNELIQYALMAGDSYISNRSQNNLLPLPDWWGWMELSDQPA